MRLRSIFISNYKNLRNFKLDLDGASFIDVFVGKNVYDSANDRYSIDINLELFQERFSVDSITDVFLQFDNLRTLGMLTAGDIAIPLQLVSGVDATVGHFSDGQFQSVYIYAVVELFKDRNCLTLLDEPDAFLHPEWQFRWHSRSQQHRARLMSKASRKECTHLPTPSSGQCS